jgi:hypothetical protein
MADRKKPGVAFWATVVVVVVLLAYPLSFGPACWMVDLEFIPEQPVAIVYRPLAVCVVRCMPSSVGKVFAAYGSAFAAPDKVPASSRLLTRVAFGLPESAW